MELQIRSKMRVEGLERFSKSSGICSKGRSEVPGSDVMRFRFSGISGETNSNLLGTTAVAALPSSPMRRSAFEAVAAGQCRCYHALVQQLRILGFYLLSSLQHCRILPSAVPTAKPSVDDFIDG
ncbi:hypothetical protein PIB30_097092 [Stylosanthes scabra]|uniref:Uncharacterized protein n=1 Tax=Stylosanthes scabra TaxID=79078 RepID=A0ABU6XYP2_9FABA|nr:hypothetical protein [Stylosanthes scabra]